MAYFGFPDTADLRNSQGVGDPVKIDQTSAGAGESTHVRTEWSSFL